MNNELIDKIVESFKNPLRWEIVKRKEDYQYAYVDSITVKDLHTGILFEVQEQFNEVLCYDIYVTRDTEVVEEFVNMLRATRRKRVLEALEYSYLGTPTDFTRDLVAERFQKWKDSIGKINHLKGQENVS